MTSNNIVLVFTIRSRLLCQYRNAVAHYYTWRNKHLNIWQCCQFIVNFISVMRLLLRTLVAAFPHHISYGHRPLELEEFVFRTGSYWHFEQMQDASSTIEHKMKSNSSARWCQQKHTHVVCGSQCTWVVWHWLHAKCIRIEFRISHYFKWVTGNTCVQFLHVYFDWVKFKRFVRDRFSHQ